MITSILSNKLFLYAVIRITLVLLLIILSFFQRTYSKPRYLFFIEQNKSFECGFDQFNKEYLGFCVQYITTAFLFLIVDLEIALFIPLFVNTPLFEKGYLLRLMIALLIATTLLLILFVEVKIGGLT